MFGPTQRWCFVRYWQNNFFKANWNLSIVNLSAHVLLKVLAEWTGEDQLVDELLQEEPILAVVSQTNESRETSRYGKTMVFVHGWRHVTARPWSSFTGDVTLRQDHGLRSRVKSRHYLTMVFVHGWSHVTAWPWSSFTGEVTSRHDHGLSSQMTSRQGMTMVLVHRWRHVAA